MKILNTSDHYCLAAMVELAAVYPARLSGVALARRCGLPAAYFSRLVPDLVQRGLVTSRRGPGGGLQLARTPGELTLDLLIRVPRDEAVTTGPGQRLAAILGEAVRSQLQNLTLAEVAAWPRPGDLAPDYAI